MCFQFPLWFVFAWLPFADSARENAIKAEMEQLQGTWQVVSAFENGKEDSKEKIKYLRWTFKGDTIRYTKVFSINGEPAGQGGVNEATYKIDPFRNPKALKITTTSVNGTSIPKAYRGTNSCVYLLEGDTLKMCLAPEGHELPKVFESKPGSGIILRIATKVKS